jgi:hypothetical protein
MTLEMCTYRHDSAHKYTLTVYILTNFSCLGLRVNFDEFRGHVEITETTADELTSFVFSLDGQ